MASPATHVLIVDDSPELRDICRSFLARKDGGFRFSEAGKGQEALERCREHAPDCILLDYRLPDLDGIEFLKTLRGSAERMPAPVVFLTGEGSEAIAVEAMKHGCEDYLSKSELDERSLYKAVSHAIERHRLRERLEAARARELEVKTELLSHVSHELRTPLAAAKQSASLIAEELLGPVTADQAEHLAIVDRSLCQLQRLISALIESSRAQKANLRVDRRRADLRLVLLQAAGMLDVIAAGAGVTLRCEVPQPLPTAVFDPDRITQVVNNLVDNALKYTPGGGEISISATAKNDLITVRVQDNGQGVPEGKTARIFENLYQADGSDLGGRKGLGLGLYLCRELVRRHGGRIWHEEAPGGGAVFAFTLPVYRSAERLRRILATPHRCEELRVTLCVMFPEGERWAYCRRTARLAKHVLMECHVPTLDAILPRLHDPALGRAFTVVSRADDEGTRKLTERIRRQFAFHRVLGDHPGQPEFFTAKLDINDIAENRPERIDEVARRVEQLESELFGEWSRNRWQT